MESLVLSSAHYVPPAGNTPVHQDVPPPSAEDAGSSSRPLTREELLLLENAPRTGAAVLLDSLVCLLPVAASALALAEYLYVPNLPGNESTSLYAFFLSFFIAVFVLAFAAAMANRRVFSALRYRAPFYSVVFLLLLGYDVLTLKTGLLVLPYFPWADQVLNAFITDRAYLADCMANSVILLFTGYFSGALIGLLTGIACGYNKKINYWIAPFMKLLGAIPSTTWIPVVMVLASSLFKGAVFIIALGVWFALTIATITGINNIDKSYFEAARTLGAKNHQLILRVALPFALPNIFQGLTQGLSSACVALMVAEMIGVESGLGWYINWQRSWALYGQMYAAIILICVLFVVVTWGLNAIRRRVLAWQEGVVS